VNQRMTAAEYRREILGAPAREADRTDACVGCPVGTIGDMLRWEDETEFQGWIVTQAKQRGWSLVYHTHDSRKSRAGFPDLIMLRAGRQMVLEVKTMDGVLSGEQADWLTGFRDAGVFAKLVRPIHAEAIIAWLA
jgi:VRR-NUC domain